MTDFRALCAELLSTLLSQWEGDNRPDPEIITIARAALNTQPLAPIPVTERLPEAEDCDADGRCWLLSSRWATWDLNVPPREGGKSMFSHWQPYWVISLPEEQA